MYEVESHKMIDIINKVLQEIIGLELTRSTRAANMECLKFGTFFSTSKDENLYNVGEFGLHLQCPWRITNHNEIMVGSHDLYEQIDESAEYDPDFDWDIQQGNLRDVKIGSIIANHKLVVLSITADSYGGLSILFDNQIMLTVFPVISSKSDNEYWRLLDNRIDSEHQYVSTSEGYQL